MSWNNQYQPPSGPPPGQFGFPSPQFGAPPGPPPNGGGYNPSYNPSYAPPSGPPPGQFGFPQPGGPPPASGYNPSSSYAPPSGPPLSYPFPSGPPPVPWNWPGGGYGTETGPLPPLQHRSSSGPGFGYPGQSHHQNQNQGNGQGWQQNNPSYPGGAPINWGQQYIGTLNSQANNDASPGATAGAWYNGPPGGQTGHGTGGPGHLGGQPAFGNAHMPPSGRQHYGPSQQDEPRMHFQYSMCTGKRKGLSIGINYFGQQAELPGCIDDVNNFTEFLCRQFNYKKEDIVTLTDDATNPRQRPTMENIIAAMRWLVKDAQPNDSLFFHYSGHGGQTKDFDGDEASGYDEVIYPVDFEQNGHIVDDEMHAIMVAPLPEGCRLTAIFDSSHSSSALDLPYTYSTEGRIKEPGRPGIFRPGTGRRAMAYARQTRTSPADVIVWCGAKGSRRSTGDSLSYAISDVLKQRPQQTYQELLNNILDFFSTKDSKKAQLSSSHPMDTTVLFIA